MTHILRIQRLQSMISRNTQSINQLHTTIRMYRNIIKDDEKKGKLKHIFEYAPLKRVHELAVQLRFLKAENADLREQKKGLLHGMA